MELLVSSCDRLGALDGGLHLMDTSRYTISKLYTGDTRGFDKNGNNYFIVDNAIGCIIVMDSNFNVVDNYRIDSADAHGLRIYKNYIIVVETDHDRVSLYNINDFRREAVIVHGNNNNTKRHHYNDIYIVGDTMYLSMFSYEGAFDRNKPDVVKRYGYNGAIVSIDLHSLKKSIIYQNLRQPHSIIVNNSQLYYCSSSTGVIHRNDEELAYLGGYIRGLCIDEAFYAGICNIGIYCSSTGKAMKLGSAIYQLEII